ncbi:MAG: class I SAM-dependent methyltransferase, partial [Candidatus Omnitrophica bacterium]|nr:class I SAM-dependent methyltransferase [Candidatus Omnitrophota bacterium]
RLGAVPEDKEAQVNALRENMKMLNLASDPMFIEAKEKGEQSRDKTISLEKAMNKYGVRTSRDSNVHDEMLNKVLEVFTVQGTQGPYPIQQITDSLVAKKHGSGQPPNLLDAGMGHGLALFMWKLLYGDAVEVYGIDKIVRRIDDMSPEQFQRLLNAFDGDIKGKIESILKEVNFRQGNITTEKFLDQDGNPVLMDIITCFFVLQYLSLKEDNSDPFTAWLNLFHQLADNGTFVGQLLFHDDDDGRANFEFYKSVFDSMRDDAKIDVQLSPLITHVGNDGKETGELVVYFSAVRKDGQKLKLNIKPVLETTHKFSDGETTYYSVFYKKTGFGTLAEAVSSTHTTKKKEELHSAAQGLSSASTSAAPIVFDDPGGTLTTQYGTGVKFHMEYDNYYFNPENIEAFPLERFLTKPETKELTDLGLKEKDIRIALTEDFRTHGQSLPLDEDLRKVYLESFKQTIKNKKDTGGKHKSIRIYQNGVGEKFSEFSDILEILKQAFQEMGLDKEKEKWRIELILYDYDRMMLGNIFNSKQDMKFDLELLPFHLDVYFVEGDMLDGARMKKTAERYGAADYIFSRNNIYGQNAVNEGRLSPAKLVSPSHEELFAILNVYLATKNAISNFSHPRFSPSRTRYIIESTYRKKVLHVPGAKILDDGTIYEVDNPKLMEEKGIVSFLKYVESQGQPVVNEREEFRDSEKPISSTTTVKTSKIIKTPKEFEDFLLGPISGTKDASRVLDGDGPLNFTALFFFTDIPKTLRRVIDEANRRYFLPNGNPDHLSRATKSIFYLSQLVERKLSALIEKAKNQNKNYNVSVEAKGKGHELKEISFKFYTTDKNQPQMVIRIQRGKDRPDPLCSRCELFSNRSWAFLSDSHGNACRRGRSFYEKFIKRIRNKRPQS